MELTFLILVINFVLLISVKFTVKSKISLFSFSERFNQPWFLWKRRMLLIDFLIAPCIPQDLPWEFDATAPPIVIVGYPGNWGIHKLCLRVKFKKSIRVIPASTVIVLFSLSNFIILLNFFKSIVTPSSQNPRGLYDRLAPEFIIFYGSFINNIKVCIYPV